jgi:hypothetical protein
MIAVYLAHQLSAPTREGMDENREKAAHWAAWLWKRGFSVECSWIVCTSMLEETPENRELGLRADCELVRRCDVMVLCGPRVSRGMLREAGAAKVIIDFTYLGLELPTDDLEWFNGRPVTLKILEELDLLNAAEEANKRASDKTTPSPPPPGFEANP